MAVPAAIAPDIEGGFALGASEIARCDSDPATTAEEQEVVAAGWAIFAPDLHSVRPARSARLPIAARNSGRLLHLLG